MKNLYSWLLVIIAFSMLGIFSCNSTPNKQVKEPPKEAVEEFDVDSASYSEDTTVTDDEGVMEDTTEEVEN